MIGSFLKDIKTQNDELKVSDISCFEGLFLLTKLFFIVVFVTEKPSKIVYFVLVFISVYVRQLVKLEILTVG